MNRDSIEWRHIGEDRFNRIVEALLTRMYHHPSLASTVEVIDGRGGDGGIDVAVYVDGKVDRIFQLKHFPEGFSGGFRDSRRRQIKDSFDTSWTNHRPPKWTLVFPGNPTIPEGKYVTGLGKGKKVTPTVWGRARLDSELARFPDLLDWATRDSLVETLKSFGQETAALGGPNDLEDRVRALHKLADTRSPYWGEDFSVSEHGFTKIIRAKHPRAAELEPLGFRFNVTTEDPSLSQSIQGVLDYGARRRVSIPGAAVSDFSAIGPDWFREDAGDVQLIEIPPEDPMPTDHNTRVTLEFLDDAGFVRANHQGLLTRKSRGQKGIAFTALFYGVFELDAEIPFEGPSAGNLSVSLVTPDAAVSDVKKASRVLEDFKEGATIQILWEGKRLLRAATDKKAPGLIDPVTELLIDDLLVLEEKLNATFVVPATLTNRDRVMIRVARLLVEGWSTWLPPGVSLTAETSDDPPEKLAGHLRARTAVLMRNPAMPIEIQGSKFNLGPVIVHHPDTVVRDWETVVQTLAEGAAVGTVVNFDPQGEQLIRVIPMSGEAGTPQLAGWGLPDIPVPNLEQQNTSDVERIEEYRADRCRPERHDAGTASVLESP
ncbi:hypothetical protein AB0N24_22970 [Arthrobacter sp. NPDC093128]|uniref:hypothetical protein n=1 Tax=Arthrobacter sp. NPDC093128 TaxID=3154979 RepID=UPI003436E715